VSRHLAGVPPHERRLTGLRVHTHDVSIGADTVRKRYVSATDDEAEREWRCLRLIEERAPDTAPRPVRRDVAAGWIEMTRIAGEPLGDRPLVGAQVAALGRTLRTLWSVPIDPALPERHLGPSSLPSVLRARLDGPVELPTDGERVLVRAALDAARALVAHDDASPVDAPRVLGIADLNPSNVLWDGTRCRLVDFENGGASDVGYELADHLEHIAIRRPGRSSIVEPDALLAAVGATPEERRRHRRIAPLFAAFWFERLLPGRAASGRNPPEALADQARRVLELVRT
jgi:hypothetical protein